MNREKTSLDVLYESCTPFDEGEIAKTQAYRKLLARIADLEVPLAQCVDPAQVDFDEYQDCTSCDIECERRHYFMQGFRMGYEAGRGEIHSLLENTELPGI